MEKDNETSLPKQEEFYSNLNTKDITDADYIRARSVCKHFKIKSLSRYYDLYLKCVTLFLADVFQNFRKMCLKIYHLDPATFLLASGFASQIAVKKTEVMLLMVEKDIRGGICHAIHRYAKANNKYMKDYYKNK